jgi:hypothetical protein
MSARLPRRYRGNRPENSKLKNYHENSKLHHHPTQVKNPTVIRLNSHNNHYVSKQITKIVIMTKITLKKFDNKTLKPQYLSTFQSAKNAASLSHTCCNSSPETRSCQL